MNLQREHFYQLHQVLNAGGSAEELLQSLSIDTSKFIDVYNTKQTLHWSKFEGSLDEIPEFLQLRKVMWNEIELVELNYWQDLLIICLLLRSRFLVSETNVAGYINQLYKGEYLDSEDLTLIFISLTNIKDFPSMIDSVLSIASRFGTATPSLTVLLNIYADLEQNPGDFWREVGLKASSIKERPEFIMEIIDVVKTEVLEELVYWVDFHHRAVILNEIIKRKIKGKHVEEFKGSLAERSTSNLPPSYQVLGEDLSQFPAQVLDQELYNSVHQKHIASWLPKYVYSHPESRDDLRIFFPGGAGIGHSAIILKTNNGILLLDYGLSVVNNSMARWHPLLEKLDAVLLSHAHMDHSGAIPLLMQNQAQLPIFGTSESKLIGGMLWNDTKKILQRRTAGMVVNTDPVLKSLTNQDLIMKAQENFTTIRPEDTFSILPNVSVTSFDAGHLFGSVGYLIDYCGKRLYYTGDFNLGGTNLLKKAKYPTDVDTLVFDGTNFGRTNSSTTMTSFKDVLNSSSRIILPAFSIGRSQEMLYQLKHTKGIEGWNIILTGMGGRLTRSLNFDRFDKMTRDIQIKPTVQPDEFIEKTIVIAGQGMLQAGTSRNLLENTCNDSETSIVFSGYQAPNTLGFHLLRKQKNLIEKYKQQFHRIKFSGHSSGKQLDEFLSGTDAEKIMVHSPDELHRTQIDGVKLPI